MPLVTVLLPVYNAEKYLAEAISSVLAQTFTDFELLIVDDGSTDRSPEIIHGLRDTRIRYLRNEENQKLIRTLNRGLKEAKGEFIARMDSDDICFPQRLERQLQFFRREPDTAVAGSFAIRIDENSVHGAVINRPVGNDLARNVWLPTPLLHPTVMMRRSVVDRGFIYDENCLHCEDYDFWIRIAKAGLRIENLPAPMLYYRVHGGGISFQNRALQLSNSFQVFCRHYGNVKLSFEEYCSLIGARDEKMPWRRRLEILRTLAGEKPMSLWVLVRQAQMHLRLSIMGG
ncbi:MAG: glycosyltransferase family 2 protein [Bacteriovoracia bacterium]